MPEGSLTFNVRAPLESVGIFLADLRKVGACIPGARRFDVVDEKNANWEIEMKIGPLKQRFQVRTETAEQNPPHHGKFRREADTLNMTGTIDLAPAGNETQVTYRIAVDAKGPLARIMDNFMTSKLDQQTQEFAANVKKALET